MYFPLCALAFCVGAKGNFPDIVAVVLISHMRGLLGILGAFGIAFYIFLFIFFHSIYLDQSEYRIVCPK